MQNAAVKLTGLCVAIGLVATSPAEAVDMSMIRTVVRECKTTAICNCPRENVGRLDMRAICGEDPPIALDNYGNWTNKREQGAYNACQTKVLDENELIDQYNSLASQCKMKEAQSSRFAQQQAAIQQNRENAAAAERARIAEKPREEPSTESAVEPDVMAKIAAAQQPRPQMPQSSSPPRESDQLISGNGYKLDSCAGHDYTGQLICVTSDPNAPNGAFYDILNGTQITVRLNPHKMPNDLD